LAEVSEVLTAPMRLIALMKEAVSTSKTSVNIYHTTWLNIPEDSHLQELTLFYSFPNIVRSVRSRRIIRSGV
jgi:hypothetical protein